MTEPTLCPICTAELDVLLGETVCSRCVGRLRGLLLGVLDEVHEPPVVEVPAARAGDAPIVRLAVDGGRVVPGLASSLEAAVRGELRFAAPGASARSTTARLPLAPHVVYARDELVRVLAEQAEAIAAVRGLDLPRRALVPLASWHAEQLPRLATHESGPERVEIMTEALVAARRVVDHPRDERMFRGRCTGQVEDDAGQMHACGTALYARPGVAEVECTRCGATYGADGLRLALLAKLRVQLVTAAEASRALGALGVEVRPSTIRWWVHRGLLKPVRPFTYKLGDVRAVAEREAERRARLALERFTRG